VQNSASVAPSDGRLPPKDVAPRTNAVSVEVADSANPKDCASSALALLQPNQATVVRPRKRQIEDGVVRKEFKEIVKGDRKKTESYCKHCEQRVQTGETVNVTKLAGHLISVCRACPSPVREIVSGSSRAWKKTRLLFAASRVDDALIAAD
jgi:hypothetical protein